MLGAGVLSVLGVGVLSVGVLGVGFDRDKKRMCERRQCHRLHFK